LAILCVQMALGRWRDPARPATPVAYVHLHAGAGTRHEVRQIFSRRGWRVRFAPEAPQPLDVRLELAGALLPRESPFDRWPLVTTAAELDSDGTFVRLQR